MGENSRHAGGGGSRNHFIACIIGISLKGELPPIEKNKVSTLIVQKYRPILNWLLDHRKLFFIFPMFILLMGAFSFSQLGKEFMPSLNEGEILYMPVTTPDVSMTKARELLAYTDRQLSNITGSRCNREAWTCQFCH